MPRETEQRLYALDAWRETPFYSDRERAALAWTEAVTITNGHVPDEVFDTVRQHFSEEELVNLTLAVTMINTWNRLSIAFGWCPEPINRRLVMRRQASLRTLLGSRD